MNETLVDRCLLLVEIAPLVKLEEAGSSNYKRWQNIRHGQARLRADEVEILGRVFPEYRWWIMTGEVWPEVGQRSPDYDEENKILSELYTSPKSAKKQNSRNTKIIKG